MRLFSKNQTRHALVLALLTVMCLISMEVTGNNESFEKGIVYQGIFTMIAPVFVFISAIFTKRKILGGGMTWKQGVFEGFKVSLLFGLLSPFVFLAYYLWVNPAIVTSMESVYVVPGASFSTIVMIDMAVQLVSAIFFGLIISMIVSLFLKKKARGIQY